jgi:hypothetical protein
MDKRKPHTFRLRSDLVKRMKHIAIDLGVPFNALVEEGLELVISKYEKFLKSREEDNGRERKGSRSSKKENQGKTKK